MNSRILLLPIIGATTFFILLFTFTKLFGPIPFSVTSVTTTKQDVFNVRGEGKVSAKPDIAKLSVGVQANAPTVKGAQDQINGTINKVSTSIKQLGIDEKDIKTENYTIYPNIDYSGTLQRITGYSATTNLSIKIRDLDKVNLVVDAASTSGANQINGLNFELEDKKKFENEARKKGVEDAKSKSQKAAKAAGFTLGNLINYQESIEGVSPPYPVPLNAAPLEARAEKATQIEPGSSEVRVVVTLSYEIR